jgi:TP901 family phage tail tape measure protein
VAAQNDVETARGLADRIALERLLGTQLDATIRRINQKAEADRRAKAQLDSKLNGEVTASSRLIAPASVRAVADQNGSSAALAIYKSEQEAASAALRAKIQDTNATLEQVAAARERLQLANANVAAAQRLVAADKADADALARQVAADKTERQRTQVALASQYAREQIASLGHAEALNRAIAATVQAEERLRGATSGETSELRAQVELARRREQLIRQAKLENDRQQRSDPSGRVQTAFTNTALYGAVAGGGYAAFGAIQQAVTEVLKLEDEFAKLQAISNSTDTQLQSLKSSIYGIGENSRFSTSELVKVSQTLAQAGVSAAQMTDVLKSVSTLAVASGSTPAEAVNLVTAALGSFQLQASEAGRIADLMTSALNRTKLTVQQVGQAIQYVGATAYEQNISLETLLATVGAIAQGGVKSGSTIGTGLRQFLVDLQTPSTKLTAELDKLGIKTSEVNVAANGLSTVLETLKSKGFGATQAYAGLETRAAAAYLVLKNNVDVMDQLQLSFAQSGAAATANERAMNSLTAQWQRFKNILGEDFAKDLEGSMSIAQKLLTMFNDAMTDTSKTQKGLEESTRSAAKAFYEFQIVNDAYNWLKNWAKASDGSSESSKRLETQLANSSDAVDAQRTRVTELDKEMARLAAQKETLRGHDIRASVEIATLTSRFEGLAVQISDTGNRYDALTSAASRYRVEQLKLLNSKLTTQSTDLVNQSTDAQLRRKRTISQLQGNSDLSGQLSFRERSAVAVLNNPNANKDQVLLAQSVLADAQRRVGDANNPAFNRKLSDALTSIITTTGTIAANQATLAANSKEISLNLAQSTEQGTKVKEGFDAIDGLLTKMNGAPIADRKATGAAATSQLNTLTQFIAAALKGNISPELRNYLTAAQAEAQTYRQQIAAGLAPTKAEKTAADRAQREADKRPKVTQSDIDAIISGLGLRLGSGQRSAAEQDALYRAGKTNLTSATSPHTNGIARDVPTRGMNSDEVRRAAATLRAQFAAQGIDAQVVVESGKGGRQGTGPHIHVGVRNGTRLSKDTSAAKDDQYQSKLNDAQISLDEGELARQLKALTKSTTKESFDAATKAAKATLDKVNGELMGAAMDELAKDGIAANSVLGKAKLAQVQQKIEANLEDYQQKIADALIKGAEAQIKAAQTAFDKSTQPSQAALQRAQSESAGLDAYSLRNKVPDYVKTLANDRTAQAQENVARAQLAAYPAQIQATEASIAQLTSAAGDQGVTPQVAAQIAQLNVELEKLKANKAALDAQLGASGLLPANVGQGLQQAIQAYEQANNLNETFSQNLTRNLGGAITTLDNGLTTMFSNVMSGSNSALGAFANFALGIMNYIEQLAAQMLAKQVLNGLFSAFGSGFGAGVNGAAAGAAAQSAANDVTAALALGRYNGGPIISRASGGEVSNGSTQQDSVRTNLARGEWVIQKKAVDSVGSQFMARLNQHGSKALGTLQGMPKLDMKNTTETNVYVVPGDRPPQLGKNDILVTMQEDIMYGSTKRLIQRVVREG